MDKKQLGIATLKTLFGLVPFGGGNALEEMFFEYRGRIKQDRINRFVEMLAEAFKKHGDINLDEIQSEQFSDLLESVFRRVSLTGTVEKHRRFRDVLVRQAFSPNTGIDNAEKYLTLISELSENEIWILNEHLAYKNYYDPVNENRMLVQEKFTQRSEELSPPNTPTAEDRLRFEEEKKAHQSWNDRLNAEITARQYFRSADYFHISEGDYDFYKQTLYSKGLLLDKGMGAMDYTAFKWMQITEFGKQFLEFIMSEPI